MAKTYSKTFELTPIGDTFNSYPNNINLGNFNNQEGKLMVITRIRIDWSDCNVTVADGWPLAPQGIALSIDKELGKNIFGSGTVSFPDDPNNLIYLNILPKVAFHNTVTAKIHYAFDSVDQIFLTTIKPKVVTGDLVVSFNNTNSDSSGMGVSYITVDWKYLAIAAVDLLKISVEAQLGI